jgi:hypothetical protein
MGPYSTREAKGQIRFGLRMSAFAENAMLARSSWAHRKSPPPKFDYPSYLPAPAIADIDRFHISEQVIRELPSVLNSVERAKRFERFQRVVLHSSLAQLNDVLHRVLLPSFFQWYPQGQWMFATANRDFHIALAVLRVLGATIELADRDYQQLQAFGPLRMMTEAQTGGVFYAGRHLSIPVAMFLPVMYGTVASKVTLGFVFLFDEPIDDVREPFPRSGLELFRSEASGLFGQELGLDLGEITPDAIDTFQLITPRFEPADVREFIDQYISQLNGLFTYLLDPANYATTDSDTWIGLAHYRTWLTFERLTDEILFLLTDDSAYLRKMALFRVLDQISSLITDDIGEQSSVFRRLVLPKPSTDEISLGLEAYKGPVGEHLRQLLSRVRADLRSTVLSGIFVPNAYDKSAGDITLSDGKVVDADSYVSGLVRELRNTYHGYHTTQFDRYLLINSGNTPDSLPALAVLAYLALIAKPKLFITRKWD